VCVMKVLLIVLEVIVGAFIYLNIGYLFAYMNWKVDRHGKPEWAIRVLFPFSKGNDSLISIFSEGAYKILISLIWPLKIVWLILALPLVLVFCLIATISLCLIKVVTSPIRKIVKINGVDSLTLKKIWWG